MKNILFFGNNFYEYDKLICEALENTLGAKVHVYDFYKMEPKYKNIFEKIYDEIYYSLTKHRVLKDKKRILKLEEMIKEIGNIDYVFVVGGYKIKKNVFEYVGKMKSLKYIHFWDSCSKFTTQKEIFKYFDYKSTYDMEEAKTYDMLFVPNFYNSKNISLEKIEKKYDVFTIMNYNERFKFLERIAKNLKEKGISYCFKVRMDKKHPQYEIEKDNKYIEIINDGISIEKMYEYIGKSKSVLEIGYNLKGIKEQQGGLTFRAIDALGNSKKLITTYDFIKKYDFYDEENIKVISENNFEIKKEFFESDYKEIPKEIYESYNEKNWIKKIFREV